MTPLPTLGGHNAVAYNNNNVGQVVGVAQSSSQDPSCLVGGQQQPPFYPLQQKLPVIWEGWRVKPLPLPSGDLAGEAYAINDLGQVVGSSGECLNFRIHALMWQNGKVVRLGSLGGVLSSSPASINNRGDVTGYSDLSGDATFHAFLWRKGVMIDIGTLPGDYFSYGNEINNQDQVVGTSCDINFNCRPFLWQNGTMNDLNTLIPANSNLYLLEALSINDLGEITGYAFDQTLGSLPAFLAVVASDVVGNAVAARAEAKVTLPDNVRMMVKQQLKTGRFGLHIPSF